MNFQQAVQKIVIHFTNANPKYLRRYDSAKGVWRFNDSPGEVDPEIQVLLYYTKGESFLKHHATQIEFFGFNCVLHKSSCVLMHGARIVPHDELEDAESLFIGFAEKLK